MSVVRFDHFCEKFAQCYKPISHKPGRDGKGKRFFRHDTLDERIAFVKSLITFNETDLIMSVITAYDGELTRLSENATQPNFIAWRRHVLFWARQEQGSATKVPMDSEDAAAEAKTRAVDAAVDFIAFLSKVTDKHLPPQKRIKELEGIQLDELEIATLPVAYNGWWAAVINFDHLEPREKCVIDNRYQLDLVEELFPNIDIN